MLQVNNIDVFYGDLQALWDVTFAVDEGDFIGIVGANGAGKTTTLCTISGINTPRSGNIWFNGNEIGGLPPHRIVELGIAHIPEGRRLFPYLSVQENLEIGAYIRRAREHKQESLRWVYGLFPVLKERKNQLAGTLSGGEQQMVAIARGLMSKPKLLMLDEPSLGLAPKLVLKTFEMVKKINEDGITIILVEQNVRTTLDYVSKAFIIETGRIVLEGSGKQLLDNEYVKKAYLGL